MYCTDEYFTDLLCPLQEEDRLKGLLEDLQMGRGGLSSEDVRRWPVAQRFANLARELAVVGERLSEKEEQIGELKSERSNTRVSYGLDYVCVCNYCVYMPNYLMHAN